MCGPRTEAFGFMPAFLERPSGKTHSIMAMQNAVMVIWHHSKSTNENPDHELCLEGENSWCGFQSDIAKGTSDYVHRESIPQAVANATLPTFEDS